jgi:hypothetical protein
VILELHHFDYCELREDQLISVENELHLNLAYTLTRCLLFLIKSLSSKNYCYFCLLREMNLSVSLSSLSVFEAIIKTSL